MDPYKVLNVPMDFSLEQLKTQYKKIAFDLHPDRNKTMSIEAAKAAFQMVTQCYKKLLEKYLERQGDKPHYELKQQARDYTTNPVPTVPQKFSLDKFNRAFEQHKVADENDDGYQDWLKRPDLVRDLPKQKQVIKYQEPIAFHDTRSLGYTELGVDKVTDFSGKNQSIRNLNFMDLKKAYLTETIIDPNEVATRKEYKSVKDLESERASVSHKMTAQELEEYMKYKKHSEIAEQKRLQNIQKRDQVMQDVYSRTHKLFLSSS